MGMAVTNAYHGMSAVDVKIFLTIVVPYLTALTLYDIYIICLFCVAPPPGGRGA